MAEQMNESRFQQIVDETIDAAFVANMGEELDEDFFDKARDLWREGMLDGFETLILSRSHLGNGDLRLRKESREFLEVVRSVLGQTSRDYKDSLERIAATKDRIQGAIEDGDGELRTLNEPLLLQTMIIERMEKLYLNRWFEMLSHREIGAQLDAIRQECRDVGALPESDVTE